MKSRGFDLQPPVGLQSRPPGVGVVVLASHDLWLCDGRPGCSAAPLSVWSSYWARPFFPAYDGSWRLAQRRDAES